MAAKSKRERKAIARKGGLALFAKRGVDWMRKIGKKGGKAYVEIYRRPGGQSAGGYATHKARSNLPPNGGSVWRHWRTVKRDILKAVEEKSPQEFP